MTGILLSRSANGGAFHPILVLTPAADQPAPSIIARLKNAYELRNDLDSGWAARPLQLIHERGKLALQIEDPGGEMLRASSECPGNWRCFCGLVLGLPRR